MIKQQFSKGDTAFYTTPTNLIVRAVVLRAFRDGRVTVEAQFFYYEGKDTGPYIGQRFTLGPTEVHVSALAADYAIQARRGRAVEVAA